MRIFSNPVIFPLTPSLAFQAASGIAHLLKTAMVMHGTPEDEAVNKIYMFDKDGLLVHVSNYALKPLCHFGNCWCVIG